MNSAKKLKRNLVYLTIRMVMGFLNRIPHRLALFTGSLIGLTAWRLLVKDRYLIHRHLSLAFDPLMSSESKQNIARTFFINSGKNLVDVCRFKKYFNSQIKPMVSVTGLEEFDNAYHKGKGLIGITGHIGNFELLPVYMASLGYRIGVIGRQLYESRLDELLVGNRKAFGITNFTTTDSPRKILSWLKTGGALGVLIDTDSTRIRTAFVPFFGRPANTPIGQALIGLRTGSAFLPIACLRTDDNHYRIIIKPEVKISSTGNLEHDAYLITVECTRELEKIIMENKSQWIWLHNRWHTRPVDST